MIHMENKKKKKNHPVFTTWYRRGIVWKITYGGKILCIWETHETSERRVKIESVLIADVCVAVNLKNKCKKNHHNADVHPKSISVFSPCSWTPHGAASRELSVQLCTWHKSAHFLFSAVRMNGCCQPTPTEAQEPRITNRRERKLVLRKKRTALLVQPAAWSLLQTQAIYIREWGHEPASPECRADIIIKHFFFTCRTEEDFCFMAAAGFCSS